MSNVDWEGLKARWRLGNPIILPSEFPAILAAHERDQRVILAAEKLREDILTINRDAWQGEGAICRSIARQSDAALAEFDKAKR